MAQGHQYQPPSTFPTTPRTGGKIFDAIPGPPPLNYGDYPLDCKVDTWTQQFTDPNYLISPSEHMVGRFSNPDTPDLVQQTMPHRPQINIPPPHTFSSGPIEPQSPQPAQVELSPDMQGFVNYNASSSLFTDSYITERKPPPSSRGNLSLSHYPHLPCQQVVSPSVVGPDSSSGVFSFHSDQAMMLDPFPVQMQFLQPPIPVSSSSDLSGQSVDGGDNESDGLNEVDELLKDWTTVF
jgi:hypothetical protein